MKSKTKTIQIVAIVIAITLAAVLAVKAFSPRITKPFWEKPKQTTMTKPIQSSTIDTLKDKLLEKISTQLH